jgi:acyl transferase domain-containing protein
VNLQNTQCPVAVVGMSCFFPKSPGTKAYWRLLYRGEDAITEVPSTHWSRKDYFDPDPKTPDHVYCTRGGFLSPVAFDPSEFGVPPSALEATDSSQLLALVAARDALADAGAGIDRSRTSVILGVTGTQELVIPLSARLGFPRWRRALDEAGVDPERARQVIDRIAGSYVPWQESSFPGLLGNVVAGRISNRLDLGGTNCVVDAACASSMAALHLALLELYSGRCDTVIAGGVDTLNDIFMHMCFSKTQILSPTGDVRPFSRHADGTLLGEGLGLVVLKRLTDAERDGNRVYAVIKGIGAASDGRSQSIYAPRIEGQAKALAAAYAAAGIDPSTVTLVEAHGTGTRVGDKVEFQALCQVLGGGADSRSRCALGSVKSMIGHTKAAAGAAGLVKTVLALHHKVLPPTLKAEEPDPALDIDASPFYLNTRARPWLPAGGHPRRAAVSSFGFGGSNFHVVLEEHRPEKAEIAWDGSVEILAFSADDPGGLRAAVAELADDWARNPNGDARAHAAAGSRARFSQNHAYRLLAVADDATPATAVLERALATIDAGGEQAAPGSTGVFFGGPGAAGRLAFLFPGQGSQYPGMGLDAVCTFPQAMAVLEDAERGFPGERPLNELIYPRPEMGPREAEAALRATDAAQPAIGAVSLAMLRALEVFGLKPDATGGHSFGELTALCAAGWLAEGAFHGLAAARGRFMAQAGAEPGGEPGGMVAVRAPLSEIEALIRQARLDVVLANRNGPDQGVLSGPRDAIAAASALFREAGHPVTELAVAGAFHSRLVQTAQQRFARAVFESSLTPSAVPVFSNSTARPYPADADTAKRLLGAHLLEPVDFVGQVEAMYQAGIRTFVEIGPRSVLTGLVASILKGRPFEAIALDLSSGRRPWLGDLARVLCRLAALGLPVRLGAWETPAPEPRKARMQVPIQGANYRPPAAQPAAGAAPSPAARPATLSAAPPGPRGTTKNPEPVPGGRDRPAPRNEAIMPEDTSDTVGAALRSVQEGLRTIQAIQIQTAQAHQKFLETQSEATRILLELVQNTGRLAEPAPGAGDAPRAGRPLPMEIPAAQASPAAGEPSGRPSAAAPAPIGSDRQSPSPSPASAASPRSGPVADDPARTRIERALLAVVSELTGYPVEMLGLQMDIEADLGIDSIKRVEILSALEEKIPGLPSVAPEDMGRLKTLAQIIAFLSAPGNGPAERPEPAAAEGLPRPESAGVQAAVIERALLAVVSELTGYPVEMLGLQMDIEADLGIDSIKRVEILSALEEKIPGLPSVAPEDMGRLKTLAQIIAFLSAPGDGPAGRPGQAAASEAAAPTLPERPAAVGAAGLRRRAPRRVVALVDAPPLAQARISVPPGRKVFVTDDRGGLSKAIVAELGGLGLNTVLISVDILRYKKDLPHAAGLIIVANPLAADMEAELRHAFELTRALAPDLLESARLESALFATVTRLDGGFGFGGEPLVNPLQGALAGLAKTAAAEWPDVRCHALDIAPGWDDLRSAARAVVRELTARGPVEIGLDHSRRSTPVLVAQEAPAGGPDLNPGDVVVLSGGARGIAAACALELAVRVRPTLILIGRSPEPTAEPDWLQPLAEESAVKKAILANEFGAAPPRPAELEQRFRQLMANREITRNLQALTAAGATAHYYAADVRDAERVRGVLSNARARYGPVRGLIHGAGVLEDRLIVDKSSAQFAHVFDTKVKGFRALLDALPEEDLKTVVVFSSVTARIGNKGQADYAMANEALNKMLAAEAGRRPGCRMVSINWGPWEGGMVTAALMREFQRQGVTLLPVADGACALVDEMGRAPGLPVEVVIGGTLAGITTVTEPAAAGSAKAAPQLCILFEQEIDVTSYPVLNSHVIDGRAVVPLALMTEWFGHGALHENPGLMLHGLEDIRILNGIRLGEHAKLIRLLAGKPQRRKEFFEVALELRNGVREGKDILHSTARALLAEDFTAPPAYRLPEALAVKDYPRSVEEIYAEILFHGSHLHGLRAVHRCVDTGMLAEVAAAPAPGQWVVAPLRHRWLCDPLVLDSAFQMASLWCYEQRGCVSLPSRAASYRQFRDTFPAEGVTVVLEVREASAKKLRGDFTFLDASGGVVAQLTGYEAVMDPLLNRAFKPEKQLQEPQARGG